MRRTKNQSAEETATALGPGRGINAANYVERARQHVALAGGAGFTIRAFDGQKGSLVTNQPVTESQWMAWVGYFAWKGIPYKFALSHGMMTVPAEWPEQFDSEIPETGAGLAALDRYASIPVVPKENREAMRRRVGELFAKLQRRISDWGEKPKAMPKTTTEDALREYGAQPIAVSPELRKAIGAQPPRHNEPLFD